MTILPTGECFSDAMEYLNQKAQIDPAGVLKPGAFHVVVHAICKDDDTPKLGWFAHGWVEAVDECIFAGIIQDTGEKVWISILKETYYGGLHIQHPKRYTITEVLYLIERTGTLGPWEEPYACFTRQGIQSKAHVGYLAGLEKENWDG